MKIQLAVANGEPEKKTFFMKKHLDYKDCKGFKTISRDESGIRSSDQLQQSYATLRGRKWHEKNGRGVGDNYGRWTSSLYTNVEAVTIFITYFFLDLNL